MEQVSREWPTAITNPLQEKDLYQHSPSLCLTSKPQRWQCCWHHTLLYDESKEHEVTTRVRSSLETEWHLQLCKVTSWPLFCPLDNSVLKTVCSACLLIRTSAGWSCPPWIICLGSLPLVLLMCMLSLVLKPPLTYVMLDESVPCS